MDIKTMRLSVAVTYDPTRMTTADKIDEEHAITRRLADSLNYVDGIELVSVVVVGGKDDGKGDRPRA